VKPRDESPVARLPVFIAPRSSSSSLNPRCKAQGVTLPFYIIAVVLLVLWVLGLVTSYTLGGFIHVLLVVAIVVVVVRLLTGRKVV